MSDQGELFQGAASLGAGLHDEPGAEPDRDVKPANVPDRDVKPDKVDRVLQLQAQILERQAHVLDAIAAVNERLDRLEAGGALRKRPLERVRLAWRALTGGPAAGVVHLPPAPPVAHSLGRESF